MSFTYLANYLFLPPFSLEYLINFAPLLYDREGHIETLQHFLSLSHSLLSHTRGSSALHFANASVLFAVTVHSLCVFYTRRESSCVTSEQPLSLFASRSLHLHP